MEKIKLNPEIKKQADKLFKLIEKEVKEKHEDSVAEAMAREWGDYLKTSKGFDMLEYANDLTLTESERAQYCLEESLHHMRDEAAYKISYLSHYALRAVKKWGPLFKDIIGLKSGNVNDLYTMNIFIQELETLAREVENETNSMWIYRAKGYREELEELKNAS